MAIVKIDINIIDLYRQILHFNRNANQENNIISIESYVCDNFYQYKFINSYSIKKTGQITFADGKYKKL